MSNNQDNSLNKFVSQMRREAMLEGMVLGYEGALGIVAGHLKVAESSLPMYELKRAKENIAASLAHFRNRLENEKRHPSIPPLVVDEYAFPPDHQPSPKPFFVFIEDGEERTCLHTVKSEPRAPYTTAREVKTPVMQEVFTIGGVRVSVGKIPAGCVVAVDGDKLYMVELGLPNAEHPPYTVRDLMQLVVNALPDEVIHE